MCKAAEIMTKVATDDHYACAGYAALTAVLLIAAVFNV